MSLVTEKEFQQERNNGEDATVDDPVLERINKCHNIIDELIAEEKEEKVEEEEEDEKVVGNESEEMSKANDKDFEMINGEKQESADMKELTATTTKQTIILSTIDMVKKSPELKSTSNTECPSSLDKLKTFRFLNKKRERDTDTVVKDIELTNTQLEMPPVKFIKLDNHMMDRKSIIEIHIASDDDGKINEKHTKAEPLQRIHKLEENIIKNLNILKCEVDDDKKKEELEDITVQEGKEKKQDQIPKEVAPEVVKKKATGDVVKNEIVEIKVPLQNTEDVKSSDKKTEAAATDILIDDKLPANVGSKLDENVASSASIISPGDLSNTEEAHDIVTQEAAIITDTDHLDISLEQQTFEKLTAEEEALDQQYRASHATFLQHLPCFKLQQRSNGDDDATNSNSMSSNNTSPIYVPKCRECRRRNNNAQTTHSNDVYCRFYEFRRLQYTTDGVLSVAGFPNPYTDPTPQDMNIWQPDDTTPPTAGYMDIQVCRYILLHAGDQFCYLWRQEAEALKLHENPNSTIAWKKIVQGVREICDVCDTTLFNYHWTCDKCGFGVCADCFKDRKEKRMCKKTRTAGNEKTQRGRDEFHWFLCTGAHHHQKHELHELMLTQIIAGDALNVLGRLLHDVRTLWLVPQVCGCLLSKQQMPADSELTALIQDMIKESQLKQQTSASSLATEETLRKQAHMEKLHAKKLEFARSNGIDYVPGRIWTKQTLGKDPITTAFDNFKHINFLRKGLAGLRRFLPPRAMTLAHSTQLAPGVPHEWLCDGKLLRLTNPMHPDNRILYQEVWKCGQPVMISEVARSLNLDLWRPEAFCRDFGDKPNDLINCLNGNLVPNQPMRHFWEGFQCIRKRLLDSHGKPMLLKLKDWPPGDDFAEILPTRYADLMKGLPMPEYTLRTGNLNIASCLPKMFVPPDLGPKMYNAYGSALHPDKGTTNLHLDISDAVNIMVYVGIPSDSDSKSQLVATQRAIAMGGCDYITRARTQSPNVVPGALWHIFPARDADKIRDLLNRVTLERGFRLEPDHDPIHDQNWYLDDKLRARLFNEYGVEGYPIVQCLGDAVFIPAGAPHQVQNLHNCIKVAEDFVSPENITHCYHLTHEFRRLSHSHTNHEDKLQIKNIIYHAIKDCCTILVRALNQRIDAELQADGQAEHKIKVEVV